jgi:hypothetical protein
MEVATPAFQGLIYLYVSQLKNRLNIDVAKLAIQAKLSATLSSSLRFAVHLSRNRITGMPHSRITYHSRFVVRILRMHGSADAAQGLEEGGEFETG